MLLSSLGAMCKSPASPAYQFHAPDIGQIVPFTAEELRTFKAMGIKRVEQVFSIEWKSVFVLNDQGQVVSQEDVRTRNSRPVITGTTLYKYNDHGLLTVRSYRTKFHEKYDSLAYDPQHRLTYYYSHSAGTTRRGKRKRGLISVHHHLKLVESSESGVILADSTDNHLRHYSLNNRNEFVRIASPDRTDSVSTENDGVSDRTKRFWYKPNKDTATYRVGREEVYTGDLIRSATVWNTLGNTVYRTHYHYDQNALLYKKENEDRYQRKELFTYYDSGLLMEHVVIDPDLLMKHRASATRDLSRITRYRYLFH